MMSLAFEQWVRDELALVEAALVDTCHQSCEARKVSQDWVWPLR